jgi:hypothetical protein
MKKIVKIFTFVTAVFIAFLPISCEDENTTAALTKKQTKTIADFISRNNIEVITSIPTDNVWGEKQFLKTSSGLYIHLVDTGEVGETVKSGELITYRFYKISLAATPDTVTRNWTTADYPNPSEFHYNVANEACTAFHEAVKIMKRHNSHAQLIVPAKIGFSEDYTTLTPYFYEFKIKLTNTY